MRRYISLQYWTRQRLLLLALIVVHTIIITVVYVQHQPLTNDEADYIEYSKRWLKGEPLRIKDVDDSKTPVTAVAWLPRIIKQISDPSYKENDWGRRDQLAGRYMMIVFFFGIVLYVYWWSKCLYGDKGWIFPVLLLVIDPLFMAFTPVVTSDVACAFVLLACMYHFYQYCNQGTWKQFILASVFTGAALITKSSLVFIPVIFLCIYSVTLVLHRRSLNYSSIIKGLLFIFICWVIVNTGFYFYNSFKTWGEIEFKSALFQKVFNSFSFVKSLPALLPEPFIQGFDQLQYHKEVGPFSPDFPFKGVFILNEKHAAGAWYYYIVTAFLKLPIGLIVLLVTSIVLFFTRFKSKAFSRRYIFLIIPVISYAFILSFLNPFQQGLRHALIIFPFLYLGTGYLWNYYKNDIQSRVIMILLICWHICSVAYWFPDIMHYTNEFIWRKENTFKYIAEFNYRQDNIQRDIQPFLQQHPDYSIAPQSPSKGKFIIPGAYVYNTTYEIHPKYAWLKTNKPVGHYRLVFLLYDIK